MTYRPKPADSLRPLQAAFDHFITPSLHHSFTCSLPTVLCPLPFFTFHSLAFSTPVVCLLSSVNCST